ncbi:hypothetical protein [Bacillus pseudomycoides]|uniref:hypothetical protein n=1 Tax=Bacillus pseudomycoides TaxID=64104 RepID=UPI001FB4E080|nr:hypothetical protein [Bacillus pseudomycoides]
MSNGRNFGNIVYHNLIGDCHTSIPVLFNKEVGSVEKSYQKYEQEEQYYANNSICIGAMSSKIHGDKEIWEIIHRGPINFNFIGEINEEQEKEILTNLKNMNLARYPIMAYATGNKIGIVLFNGITEDKLKKLKH